MEIIQFCFPIEEDSNKNKFSIGINNYLQIGNNNLPVGKVNLYLKVNDSFLQTGYGITLTFKYDDEKQIYYVENDEVMVTDKYPSAKLYFLIQVRNFLKEFQLIYKDLKIPNI